MKRVFSVLLAVTILFTSFPFSAFSRATAQDASETPEYPHPIDTPTASPTEITETPIPTEIYEPGDAYPIDDAPTETVEPLLAPVDEESLFEPNTAYPIDDWKKIEQEVERTEPIFVPEELPNPDLRYPKLRIEVKTSILIPDTNVIVDWKILNSTKLNLNKEHTLVFSSESGLKLIGSSTGPDYPDGVVTIRLNKYSGTLNLKNVKALDESTVSFNLSIFEEDDLIDSTSVILPVYKGESGIIGINNANDFGVQIETTSDPKDFADFAFSVNSPSPHKMPGYSLSGRLIEINAVNLNTKENVTTFRDPIKISIPYDPQIPENEEQDLTVYYFDSEWNDWFPMATYVNSLDKTLTVLTDHLTVFDYKTNNWQAYLPPMLQSYEVSDFTGAANYNYPIETIAAEGGVKPQLVLHYNSQVFDEGALYSQASWVGMGWSLETGSVTRDMHGTPSDLKDDTFILSVNGISGRMLPVSTGSGYTEYRLQNGSFTRIRQYSDQSWIIFANDGTNYYFENIAESTAKYPVNKCGSTPIWKWLLTKVIDKYGNEIKYTNVKYSKTYSEPQQNGQTISCTVDYSILPLKIEYSPGGNSSYRYKIEFKTSERNDFRESWKKENSSVFYDKHKLDSIDLYVNGTIIKRYALTYNNQIMPYFTWRNVNGTDVKTLALRSIQEIGAPGAGNNALILPATFFDYADGMHLSKIDNHQGGAVSFSYEKISQFFESKGGPRSYRWYMNEGCGSFYKNPWFGQYNSDTACVKGDRNYIYMPPGTAYTAEGKPYSSAYSTAVFPEAMQKYEGKYVFNITARSLSPHGSGTYIGFKWKGSFNVKSEKFVVEPNHDIQYEQSLYLPENRDHNNTVFAIDSTGLKVYDFEIILIPSRYVVSSRTETDYSDQMNQTSATWNYAYEGFSYNEAGNTPSAAGGAELYTPFFREFRGFRTVIQSLNPGESLKYVSTFDQSERGKGNLISRLTYVNGKLYQSDLYTYQSATNIQLFGNDQLTNSDLRKYADLDVYWNRLVSESHEIHQAQSSGNSLYVASDYIYNGKSLYAEQNEIARNKLIGNISQIARKQKISGSVVVYLLENNEFEEQVSSGFFISKGKEHWIPALPKSETVKSVSPSIVMRNTLYFFDNNKKLISVRAQQDGNNYSQKTFSYTDKGDVETESVWKEPATANSNPVGTPTVTKYGYCPSIPGKVCRLSLLEGNEELQVTNTEYDPLLLLPVKVSHPNGATEGASYDGLGRIKKICAPGDWRPENETCANAGTPTLRIAYGNFQTDIRRPMLITVQPKHGSFFTYFYNGFGNLIQSQTNRFQMDSNNEVMSNLISQSLKYDGLGRVIYESESFTRAYSEELSFVSINYTNGGQAATHYSYDPLGRVLQEDRVLDSSVTQIAKYAYNITQKSNGDWVNETIAYDAANKATKTQANVLGQVELIIPPSGPSTSFEYDALGQLKKTIYGNTSTNIQYDMLGQKTELNDADMGLWMYQYNYNGTLAVQTDAENQKTCLEYDGLGRLTGKGYGSGSTSCASISPSIMYTYDENQNIGFRTSMEDLSGSTNWDYDLRGNLIYEEKAMQITEDESASYITRWGYDSLDRVIQMVYPTGEVVKTWYDTQGTVRHVASSEGIYLNKLTYDQNGRLSAQQFGNGISSRYEYGDWLTQAGRMSSLKSGIGTGNQLQNLEYTYDVLGNITKIIDDGEIMNFGYDSLSRLISASGAFSENYAYDSGSGNLISKTTNGQSLGYQYSDPNHPHAVTKVGNKSYGYDANGNMTSRDGKAISYDEQGNLVQYDGKRYVYDGDGRRVMTWHEDGRVTITLGNYYEVDWEAEDVELPAGPTCGGDYCSYLPIVSHLTGLDLDGRSYYYAGALRIAMRDEERGVSWIYGDHLGSISVTADKNGILTSKTTYTPWGTTRNINGSNPSDYGFTGQRKEDDIYYYGARWYDPAIGRFMQADIIVPLNVQGTQAFDRYAYVNNNPLRYTDPTGMWMCGDQYDVSCAESPAEIESFGQMYVKSTGLPYSYVLSGSYDFGLGKVPPTNRYSDDVISPTIPSGNLIADGLNLIDLAVRLLDEFKPLPKYVPKDDLYWHMYVTASEKEMEITRLTFWVPEETIGIRTIHFRTPDLISRGRIIINELLVGPQKYQIDMSYKTSEPTVLVTFTVTCFGCMTGSYYRDSFTPALHNSPRMYISQLEQ